MNNIFKPFLVLAFAFVVVFGCWRVFSINEVINSSSLINGVQSAKSGQVIAGDPIKWTVALTSDQISKQKHFIKIPNGASNIKIKMMNQADAKTYLSAADSEVKQLSLNDRQKLAKVVSPNQNIGLADFSGIAQSALASVIGGTSDAVLQAQGQIINTPDGKAVNISSTNQDVVVEYTTPAPQITQKKTSQNKEQVTISADDAAQGATPTNVLAYATIPDGVYKVGDEDEIQIKWQNNSGAPVNFQAYDLNNNGYIDYVEWKVPHLSTQTFDIILISKAEQLDQNLNPVADIYHKVKVEDSDFASIPDGNYVRVTFAQALDKARDITVYAKSENPKNSASIQIYPVYTGQNGNQTEGPELSAVSDGVNPDFSKISQYEKYRILLKDLKTPTDTFDLKIVGNIDIDYIVDPTSIFSVLFSFDGAAHGQGPNFSDAPVLSGSTLYGMTSFGGANNDGVIFSEPVAGGAPT